MMSMLCNCCVRELLILARTWFAFGLPSKTGCDTRHDGRPDRGVGLGGLPHGSSCRLGPRLGASCAEASQPAWRAAAPAAEADTVLRAFVGVRPVRPCLRLPKGREKASSRHATKEAKTEAFSDT